MNKQKLIAIVSGLSLALLSTAALAATSDPDTQFVSGFDSDAEKAKVIYSVSGIDQEDDTTASLDCGVASGDYVYVLDDEAPAEATEVEVEELYESDEGEQGDPVVFMSEDDTDQTEYAYDSPEAEESNCTQTAVTIEPKGEGEVNHGTVVSTMTKVFGPGMGCLTSQVAQMDWGKDSYVDAEGDGVVTLDTLETSCNKNKHNDDGESVGNGQLKSQQAKQNGGKATAPGQLKKNDG